MTVAIGLICRKEAHQALASSKIFLACDSQTTRGGTKSLDAQKINAISFPHYEVFVAQAGSAELTDKAIEVVKGKAQNPAVPFLHQPASLALAVLVTIAGSDGNSRSSILLKATFPTWVIS